MLTKIIVAIFTSLGVIFLWFRKQKVGHPGTAGQDISPTGGPDQNKDELNESQAAEVVATWNILNPPS